MWSRSSDTGMYATLLVVVLLAVTLPLEVRGRKKYEDKDGAHKITMGTRLMVDNKPVDTQIYDETFKADGKKNVVKEGDICFPNKKKKRAKFTITTFTIKDSGKKGLAWVTSGGVGKHKVCFHVKSQAEKGFNFDIDIYGTYKKGT